MFRRLTYCICLIALLAPGAVTAQETPADIAEAPAVNVTAAFPSEGLAGQTMSFNVTVDSGQADAAPPAIQEVFWDFGDGVRTTGNAVTHTFRTAGSYLVTVKITTDIETVADSTEVRIYEHAILLLTDTSAPADQLSLLQQQAAREGILLNTIRSRSGGPEAIVEEELTKQLIDLTPQLTQAHLIAVWTSGSVGTNVLSKYAQHLRRSEGISPQDIGLAAKGLVLVSDTPFGVLRPAAQSVYDQLLPSYVLLTRPAALDLLVTAPTADEARAAVTAPDSPVEWRLLGRFSARTVADLNLINFLSFGINYLINQGVPASSITLILMLPVVATILAFARQVIGIKAFGLVTPAMTALSFLVMGLQYGLLVFLVILLTGTVTRALLRRLHLLYLPRMALVLTAVSLSLLLVLAAGAATGDTSILNFSIFPALILTLLAEEFIAAQFTRGLRAALTTAAWTLVLAVLCYYLVSSEIFRSLVLSYPEVVLLAIPLNIMLGRWGGLRLTEYIRFRTLLQHDTHNP
ncbi:MAG: hypothetical protein COT71_00760 [Candidatus Andersenbacteria bacterium CG10_big_fil_rev_8_21_14_0_10_54_11]|uniref:PKD domain-containing protein n=1 Tax=Candidatus Andersenbacteria bacterium CG10_big_fil_rev_8_21_14_0_10_54_11 TaxID=1974485 RepID=A0A2M6X070_9BACT|nr:MAG: hypothetical protein COT71_00760 [Candidatus Andersenbacteria bacterium CG10_big_fil_rev_8_21_14_0_10_54_11]